MLGTTCLLLITVVAYKDVCFSFVKFDIFTYWKNNTQKHRFCHLCLNKGILKMICKYPEMIAWFIINS